MSEEERKNKISPFSFSRRQKLRGIEGTHKKSAAAQGKWNGVSSFVLLESDRFTCAQHEKRRSYYGDRESRGEVMKEIAPHLLR